MEWFTVEGANRGTRDTNLPQTFVQSVAVQGRDGFVILVGVSFAVIVRDLLVMMRIVECSIVKRVMTIFCLVRLAGRRTVMIVCVSIVRSVQQSKNFTTRV
jgi:hypothetical protein